MVLMNQNVVHTHRFKHLLEAPSDPPMSPGQETFSALMEIFANISKLHFSTLISATPTAEAKCKCEMEVQKKKQFSVFFSVDTATVIKIFCLFFLFVSPSSHQRLDIPLCAKFNFFHMSEFLFATQHFF